MLPIVIPFGILIFALLAWRLAAMRHFTMPRLSVAAALAVYAAGIAANTIFPIYAEVTPRAEPWYTSVVLVPFADYQVEDAVMNILVFLPLGILFALLFAKPTWWKVLTAVTATSLGIELTQIAVHKLFGGGHIADTSDLVSNVSGGMLGYVLLLALSRSPGFARFAARFRWALAQSTSR